MSTYLDSVVNEWVNLSEHNWVRLSERYRVRPHVVEIRIGKQGIAFDRLDLDAWVDQYKARNGRPGQPRGDLTWDESERLGSTSAVESGISISKFEEEEFAKALARVTSQRRKSTLQGRARRSAKQRSTE